jgi:hypothetical protein
MKLINVNVEIIHNIGNPESTIKLVAKFEDKGKVFPFDITLIDWVYVNSKNLFDELKRVESEHPFFRLRLCESPIELKFFVYSLKEIPNLKPQVVVGPYRID